MFAAYNRCKRELRPGVRQPLSLPIGPAGPPYESKSVEYFEIGGHIGLAPVFCAHSNPRDHDDAAPGTADGTNEPPDSQSPPGLAGFGACPLTGSWQPQSNLTSARAELVNRQVGFASVNFWFGRPSDTQQ